MHFPSRLNELELAAIGGCPSCEFVSNPFWDLSTVSPKVM
jgi:hypothetical protein